MSLMTLQDVAALAQPFIALAAVVGIYMSIRSASSAGRAAEASEESARAAKHLVELERARAEVELRPRVTLDCYRTEDIEWALELTNHGPRLIDRLVVHLSGTRLVDLAGELIRGNLARMNDPPTQMPFQADTEDHWNPPTEPAVSDEYEMHDIAAGDGRTLRLIRDDQGLGGMVSVSLTISAAGSEWTEPRRFLLPPDFR